MSRATLLHHPIFTGSVALLAVNDVWLKDRYPGLLTGKLSDFAGVMVIAIALTVLTGAPRVATALTTIGFTALKLSPAVATAAAPILGGVTRTDATDLIALTALVPLTRWLEGRGLRSIWSFAAPTATSGFTLIMVALATATTTATSCETVPAVTAFAADGTTIWAQMRYEDGIGAARGQPEWAVSNDAGLTWEVDTQGPPLHADRSTAQACANTVCWRVIPRESIQMSTGDDWRDAFRFTPEQLKRIRYGVDPVCTQADEPWFGDIIILDNGTIVVSMGSQGVLRSSGDSWDRISVLDAGPTPIGGPLWPRMLLVSPVVLLAAAPALAIVGVVLRRRDPTRDWMMGSIVALSAAIGVTFVMTAGMIFGADGRLTGPVTAAATLIFFALSIVMMRRRRKIPWQKPVSIRTPPRQPPPPSDRQPPPSSFGPPTEPRF